VPPCQTPDHILTIMSGQVVEVAPQRCPNGHSFGPNRVVVGWHPCQCVEGRAGHRTYYCRECRVTVYVPPHEATTRKARNAP
jgi:hypothetical protein